MSDRTMYPTQYEALSLSQLHAMFASEHWSQLTAAERLDACQEVENRLAAEYQIPACRVEPVPMDGKTSGQAVGDVLQINSYMLESGLFVTVYEGEDGKPQTFSTEVPAVGWTSLDTIYHEGTHCQQYCENRLLDTYIPPDMNYDLYRIQACEREAFRVGESRTMAAIAAYQKEFGVFDISSIDYMASVRASSFDTSLHNAALQFHDPNIESTLNTFLQDYENGIERENPSPSYTAICAEYDNYYGYTNTLNTDVSNSACDNSTEEHATEEGLPARDVSCVTMDFSSVSETSLTQDSSIVLGTDAALDNGMESNLGTEID